MKAIRYTKYGSPDVIRIVEEAKPIATGKEVLIKVIVTTVTPTDTAMRKADPPFITRFFLLDF